MAAKPRDYIMLSGGIDSTGLAFYLLDQGVRLKGIYFDFGQKSRLRQEAAVKSFGHKHDVPVDVANLNEMVRLFIGIIEPPHIMMVEDRPGDGTGCGDSILSISIAGIVAAAHGAEVLYYGATAEDVTRVPQLLDMLRHVEAAVKLNSGRNNFRIETPFSQKSHQEALESVRSHDEGLLTWSCYWGGLYHCGDCRGCDTRKNRYAQGGLPDPTIYSKEFPA